MDGESRFKADVRVGTEVMSSKDEITIDDQIRKPQREADSDIQTYQSWPIVGDQLTIHHEQP